MYQCRDCGMRFETPKLRKTDDGWVKAVCPECEEESVWEIQTTYCRYCGARLPKGAEEYCNAQCEKKGRIAWQRERDRRKLERISPLHNIMQATENYNKIHKTRYSYGQFVTNILPFLSEEELNSDLIGKETAFVSVPSACGIHRED